MINKLSFKIGLLFFVFILIIESILFFFLYTNLANDRVDEVMNSLLARGNTHRDVLEDHFDKSTLEHVGIMESASEFIVIITDENGDIIIASDPVRQEMMEVVEHTDKDEIPIEGKVVDDKWTEGSYIATDSPITIDGEHKGHVFMFAHTDYVKKTVDQLGKHFLWMSAITIILTIVTIFILSRLITEPLIKMKKATEQLSKGRHDVALHTERKDELGELANSITTLSKDLEALKKARNEFLANIAHELRTPLTYIKGYVDIMNRPGTSEAAMQEYMTIIKEETAQLTGLINDLFQLAKMDQHNFNVNREPTDLSALLTKIVERVGPAFSEREMNLTIYCPGNILANIDPERIQQVVMNLLMNAKQHAGKGGRISIHLEEIEENIYLTIADDGEGIPADDLPYIFDKLYRVEKSRSRLSGGAGLGLAITKEIIEAHDGQIVIKSEVGKGTKVNITLPKGELDA